jgi:stage II sporulation protein D
MKLPLAFGLCAAVLSAATVRVQVNGRVITIDLEQYTAGALAGESSVFQSDEALKAMAVAARTYAVHFRGRHAAEGFDLCDTTHCQHIDLQHITARMSAAATNTSGELLWYQGKPALSYYSRDCGGQSEDARLVWPAASVPYLKSRPDPYCARNVASSHWHWEVSPRDLIAALQQSALRVPATLDHLSVAEKTISNRAQTLVLNGSGQSIRIDASSFRFAVGRALGWNTLKSNFYQTSQVNGNIIFDGKGAGHGVGLCQLGAEQMGIEKHSYREILGFYYPGTAVGLTAQGISWQKLTGEQITILSMQPSQDAATLAIADRQARVASQRTRRQFMSPVEIRIYPDVETFRNATGEPGWVAAHTSRSRIDLQPTAILKSRGTLETTLRHELIHVLIESDSNADLPIWFREGLAAYFTGSVQAGISSSVVADTDLFQTTDQTRARAANRNAAMRVADLVDRYGEETVLGWLRTDLPRDVTNASAKQAATKSK